MPEFEGNVGAGDERVPGPTAARVSPRWSVVLLLLGAAGASGCASVPPYARGRLAHPSMTTDDRARPSESHVRAVHEGAAGGGFEAGGGCGCN